MIYSLAATPPTRPTPQAQPKEQVNVTVAKPGDGTVSSVDRVIDSATVAALVSGDLKGGQTVSIKSNGQVVLEIKKEEPSALDRFKSFAGDALHATAAEASNIVAQDPSFAFKEAALLVKTQVYSGVDGGLTGLADQAFLPMIRVVSIALDVVKASQTWKKEHASKVDRAVDGSHLITDVLGLGGAVAFAIPGLGRGIATALTVAGVVGDVASYGYHVMKYFRERGLSDGTQAAAAPPAAPRP